MFGLIGSPLSHSFSRNYFTDKFASEGTSGRFVYENFELNDISDFPALLKKHPSLTGLNVTIPFKEKIVPYLDEIKGDAVPVGAVNTITIKRDTAGNVIRTTGYNTDVTGFYNTLKPLLKPNHTGALVLGTGGASKAVVHALPLLNVHCLVVSRTQHERTITYGEITEDLLHRFPVIINTTPLGTFPDIHSFPVIPYELLGPPNLLYDLVYNPRESQFLLKGRMKGAQTSNGYKMLTVQAEAAWKIWETYDHSE